MLCMVVTLDVSKLSGWLNADAPCRESRAGHIRCGEEVRGSGGARRLRGRSRGASSAQRRARLRGGGGQGAERTWNTPYMLVTLDVSKLSGWLNADARCRGTRRGHIRCGSRCGGRGRVAGDGGASSAQGRRL
eukprot:scaffold62657_cov64-Phaeocystis_antarctica.AAC.3